MSTLKTLLGLLLAAALVGIALPFALVGWQIASTWTKENTNQVLFGALPICGGAMVLFVGTMAVLIGAGIQRRMAALAPPGRQAAVDDAAAAAAAQFAGSPYPQFPAWNSGGGNVQLLPPGQAPGEHVYRLDEPAAQDHAPRGW